MTAITISIVLVLAGIIATSALGLWKTTSTKEPQKYRQTEYAGQYNPADIRGSYSFSEISQLFDIPLADLAAAFSLGEDEAKDFKCKELEAKFAGLPYEVGTGSVRMFAAFYKGLPYELAEDTYLTEEAGRILKEKSNITPEQITYLENHTVSLQP
jgi:hypothetical protein